MNCTAADAVKQQSALSIVPVNGKVVVVAIGSSSTTGFLASSPAAAYPSVLQALLDQQSPPPGFVVYNRGVNGDDLKGMESRLQRDALDLNPQVVIVQTGTNDAINGQSDAALADYAARLRRIVLQLKQRSQVIIMNQQHYASEPSIYQRYVETIDGIAKEQNVAVFDRYGLMSRQVNSGRFSLSSLLASDGFHPNDFTYRCMANVIYDTISLRLVK